VGADFWGFQAHEIVDVARGTTTRQEFDLRAIPGNPVTYPFAGVPSRQEITFKDPSAGESCDGVARTEIIDNILDTRLSSAAKVYFPFARRTVSQVLECMNGHPKVVVYQQISEQSVDDYGNVITQSTKFGLDENYSTVNTFDNSEVDWLVNRKSKSVVTSTVHGESAQRSTAYRYDSAGGLVRVIVEPGDDSGRTSSHCLSRSPMGFHPLFFGLTETQLVRSLRSLRTLILTRVRRSE
jgi:hypothetical protein